MRKPRLYNRKKRKKSQTKITKLHILIMISLIAVVVIALAISITYIIYIKTREPITPTIQPSVNASVYIPNQNVTIDNVSENNETLNITANDFLDVSPSPESKNKNTSNIIIGFTDAVVKKPKLAIVIDDMTTSEQVRNLLSIPLKLTPSFLPPKKDTPNSPLLAERMEFYMVHLPTEALNFKSEPIALLANDTYEEILGKLKRFKQEFPRGIYFNNHTGSKFTADYEAMYRLFMAMDELGLIFVDSRTTAKTKAPEIARAFGKNLLQRDVFLDNEIEGKAIKKQLRLAINKAKKNGFAIAIGHPHKKTFESINSSIEDLNEVEVVYIKDL